MIHQQRRLDCKVLGPYSIEVQRLLGRGSFSKVYRGFHNTSKELLAFKIIDKNLFKSSFNLKAVTQEIQVMKELQHPNINTLRDVLQTKRNVYIISQLCEKDLGSILEQTGGLAETQAMQVFSQVIKGMQYLRVKGMVHRDIKAANVLLKNGLYKLTDFGFARPLIEKDHTESLVGTPLYMSPQMLLGQKYTSKAQIWSLGLLLYQILYNRLPWPASNSYQLIQKIKQRPFNIAHEKINDPRIRHILSKSLVISQEERLDWNQLFKACIQQRCEKRVLREGKQNMPMYGNVLQLNIIGRKKKGMKRERVQSNKKDRPKSKGIEVTMKELYQREVYSSQNSYINKNSFSFLQ